MSQTLKVAAAGMVIFAVYLPLAMFTHHDYVPAPRPAGRAVEMMLKFELDQPNRYVTRSYVFGPSRFPDVSRISVYEDIAPMPRENFQLALDGAAYVIRIRPVDGSDPRTNGRQYWAVAGDATD